MPWPQMVLSPCAQSTHLSSSNSSSSPHPLPSDRRSRSIAGALAVPPTGQRHRSSRNPGPCWDGSFRRRSMHHTASQTASFNSPDHFVRQPGCYVQLADNTLQPRGFFEHPGLASHHDKLVSISPDQFSGIAEAVAVATYRSLSDDTRVSPLQQRDDMRTPENIPVFVMLPLDTVSGPAWCTCPFWSPSACMGVCETEPYCAAGAAGECRGGVSLRRHPLVFAGTAAADSLRRAWRGSGRLGGYITAGEHAALVHWRQQRV